MPEEFMAFIYLGYKLTSRAVEYKRVPSSALVHFRSLWRFPLDCKKVKKNNFKRYNPTIISPDIVFFCARKQFVLVRKNELS